MYTVQVAMSAVAIEPFDRESHFDKYQKFEYGNQIAMAQPHTREQYSANGMAAQLRMVVVHYGNNTTCI